jgi:hypothetical protein
VKINDCHGKGEERRMAVLIASSHAGAFFFIFSPPHRSHPLNIIISDQSAVEPLVVVCTTYTFSFCATIFFLFIFKIIFHFKKEKGEQYFIDEISIFLLESFSSIDDSVEM